jgi:hypothetical protein
VVVTFLRRGTHLSTVTVRGSADLGRDASSSLRLATFALGESVATICDISWSILLLCVWEHLLLAAPSSMRLLSMP